MVATCAPGNILIKTDSRPAQSKFILAPLHFTCHQRKVKFSEFAELTSSW